MSTTTTPSRAHKVARSKLTRAVIRAQKAADKAADAASHAQEQVALINAALEELEALDQPSNSNGSAPTTTAGDEDDE